MPHMCATIFHTAKSWSKIISVNLEWASETAVNGTETYTGNIYVIYAEAASSSSSKEKENTHRDTFF